MSGIEAEGVASDYWREGDISGLPLNKHSRAYEASIVCKPGPGALYGFTVYNSNIAAQFIQIFDAAELPDDGAVPAVLFTVAASSHLPIQYLPPRAFQVGIVMCNSSTGPTKTIGAADCYFDVQFV